MPAFKPGDLVKIRDGTHAAEIPDHRVGMIIERGDASGNYTEAYTVVFLGTDIHLKVSRNVLRTLYSPLTFETLTIAPIRGYIIGIERRKIYAYRDPAHPYRRRF